MADKKKPAVCVFDVYDMKLAMPKDDVAKLVELNDENEMAGKSLEPIGANKVELYFDHKDRLWMVKSYYTIASISEGEQILDKMSKDFRFQTPSTRVAFDLEETEAGDFLLYIRYTEVNLKREYIHHKLAEAHAMNEEQEKARIEESIKKMEEEDYIPTGPMIF